MLIASANDHDECQTDPGQRQTGFIVLVCQVCTIWRGKTMWRGFIGVMLLATVPNTASWASAYDRCVLENMKGSTSDIAAIAIKESCIRTTEVDLPAEQLQTLKPSRAYYTKLYGQDILVVSINNTTGYVITELTVFLSTKKGNKYNHYTNRTFVAPNTGSVADRTIFEMIGPGTASFMVGITEAPKNEPDFETNYVWNFTGAKGIAQ
jgi:hypothetical protein